jgi:glycosyltransferase involved in cell wall biosynthesis
MKKVGLFTTFFEATSGYSLIAVAGTQLQALIDHGYDPAVLVQENFTEPEPPSLWRDDQLDLRRVVPFMHLNTGVAEDFEARVEAVLAGLREGLADVDVCITHDIILQNWYKEHNVAMRRYAKERPDLLWLHWIHSCPTPSNVTDYPESCRYTPPPGYIIYPNSSDVSLPCQTYGLRGQEWRVKVTRFGHSIDPLTLWRYDKLTKELVQKSGLLDGEVSAIYPVRLDRGKQPEKIIRIMAGVQRAGYEPRLLVVDWQSTGERFQNYINELLALADELGLAGKVSFTSRLDDRCSQGVPRHIVTELFDLTNVYLHPSRVETYSLVVHEAILRGCLTVLNYDFPPMRELFGDAAIYMDFESDRVNRTYSPDEQTFWNDEALRLIAELKTNRAAMAKVQARREWSPAALWKEFEPLMYLPAVGE